MYRTQTQRYLLPVLLLAALLGGCDWRPPEPGIGEPVVWEELPGWENDRHAEAWPALLQQCRVMPKKRAVWQGICARAKALGTADDAAARHFFEQEFAAYRVNPSGSQGRGLVTGYYEPVLQGSLHPTERFRHAVYRRPDDLIRVELDAVYPELEGKRVRGRLEGQRLVPYYTREAIDDGAGPLVGQELLWVDDPIALFFLHVQGSGRIRLSDGRLVAVGYADQNGRPYTSIGRLLVERGEITKERVSLFTIRDWLSSHPEQAPAVLASNQSYVFFRMRDNAEDNAVGSLNVPLTPARSIAVDPSTIALGSPVWLDTTYPGEDGRPLRRLAMAQDTGGAIKGYARADLFWGNGAEAERRAGEMKQDARLYVLLPRERLPAE
jgi:membrane-bound lytic murein transglycosylase A